MKKLEVVLSGDEVTDILIDHLEDQGRFQSLGPSTVKRASLRSTQLTAEKFVMVLTIEVE